MHRLDDSDFVSSNALFLQEGAEAALSAAGLLYAIESWSPMRQAQTVVFRRHDILSLPSHPVNKRPVGAVYLVGQYEAKRNDGSQQERFPPFNGTHSEPQRRHGEERAEVIEELSGPGDLHRHLSLSHLVLHQDLTLHLQPCIMEHELLLLFKVGIHGL